MNKVVLPTRLAWPLVAFVAGCSSDPAPKTPPAEVSVPTPSATLTTQPTTEVTATSSAAAPTAAPSAEVTAPPFQEMVNGAAALKLDGVPTGSFTGARAWVPRGHHLEPQNKGISFREVQWLAVDVKKSENGWVFFDNALTNQKRAEAVPAFFALPTAKKLPPKGTIARCAAFAAPGTLAVAELATGALVVARFEGEKAGKPVCTSELYGEVETAPDGVWAFPTKLEPGAVVDVQEGGKSKMAGEVYGLAGDEVWVRPMGSDARNKSGAPLVKVKKGDVKLAQLSLTKPWKVGDKVLMVSAEGPWVEAAISDVVKDGLAYRLDGRKDIRYAHQVAKK
jgi:hypothetical protein